jgi:hypothetical protein
MYSRPEDMAARIQMGRCRRRRVPAVAVLVVGAIGALSFGPVPGVAAQGDRPAIDQYTDPFAPLATGRRAPAWNPFSRDFAAGVPARLRRQLARVDEGPALEMLLAQLRTEQARTGVGEPLSRSGRSSSRTARGGRAEDPGVVSSAARSISDGAGAHGALLFAGLVAVTAGGLAAAWMRRRERGKVRSQSA